MRIVCGLIAVLAGGCDEAKGDLSCKGTQIIYRGPDGKGVCSDQCTRNSDCDSNECLTRVDQAMVCKPGTSTTAGSCAGNQDCASSEYCRKAQCDAASGSCLPRNDPQCLRQTVCGCDGKNYTDECALELAGLSPSSLTACPAGNGCAAGASRASSGCYQAAASCPTSGTCCGSCDGSLCCGKAGQICTFEGSFGTPHCCAGLTCGSDCFCH